MATITSGSFSKDLLPFIGKWFGDELEDYDPLYSKVMGVSSLSTATTEDNLMPGFGLPQEKAEGASIQYDSTAQGYRKRYEVTDYASGFIITRNMLDDGLAISKGEKFARLLKRAMVKGRETVVATTLQNAFDSTYTGGDGKELCATDHPTQAADLANEPSSASDLDESSLEQAYIDVADWRDDRGLRIHCMLKKLVIPPQLKFEAERLLKSELRTGTANNDLNATRTTGLIPEGAMEHVYLNDDADRWFILTDCPDGLKYYNRRDIDIETDNDFDTENAKYKSVMRFAHGWTDPRGIYGSPGA